MSTPPARTGSVYLDEGFRHLWHRTLRAASREKYNSLGKLKTTFLQLWSSSVSGSEEAKVAVNFRTKTNRWKMCPSPSSSVPYNSRTWTSLTYPTLIWYRISGKKSALCTVARRLWFGRTLAWVPWPLLPKWIMVTEPPFHFPPIHMSEEKKRLNKTFFFFFYLKWKQIEEWVGERSGQIYCKCLRKGALSQ